jgi:murein DD-endopeptidase MepM/ murein hydrolase activator NlpD
VRARTLAVGSLLVTAALAGPAVATTGGPWVWPLEGPHAVSRAFDPPATRYGPGHRGADLPGRPRQAVRAAGAGRISYAGLLAGRGVVVVVHGDLRSTYEPVSATVRVGQRVTAGELIGRLDGGHPGCPAAACLHWGLLRGEVYLDPVRLVTRGPSRLLPLNPLAGVPAEVLAPSARAATPRSAPATAPRPAQEPAFSLRSGEAASAGSAVAALIAGLLLLRRPPRPPHRPVTPAVAGHAPAGGAIPETMEPHAAGLVDLASERRRRRPEVA